MKSSKLGLLILAVLLGAGGVAFGAAGPFGRSSSSDQTGNSPAVTSGDGIKERFAIFRRPRVAGDGGGADDPTARSAGARPSRSRLALVTASGDQVFLTPGRGSLCLGTSRVGNITCGPTGAALAGRIVASVICGGIPDDAINVYGAVPDGVDAVTVQRANGTTDELSVTGNAFALETKKRASLPVSFSWNAMDGPMTVSSTVPADAAASRCATPGTVPQG